VDQLTAIDQEEDGEHKQEEDAEEPA